MEYEKLSHAVADAIASTIIIILHWSENKKKQPTTIITRICDCGSLLCHMF